MAHLSGVCCTTASSAAEGAHEHWRQDLGTGSTGLSADTREPARHGHRSASGFLPARVSCCWFRRSSIAWCMACVEFSGRAQGCRQLQDLVGPTQLLDLTLEFFHSLRLSRGYDAADTGVDLMPLRLAQQRRRRTADLRRQRLHRGSRRWV